MVIKFNCFLIETSDPTKQFIVLLDEDLLDKLYDKSIKNRRDWKLDVLCNNDSDCLGFHQIVAIIYGI